MKKEIARLLVRVLRAVYDNRMFDVDVSYLPIPPLTGLCDQQRYEVRLDRRDKTIIFRSESAVLEDIKEMTD